MSRIAIVGIGCRYAGGVDSPQSFWDFVVNKKDDAIVDIPADRWDYRRFYDPDKGAAGAMYTKRGAFLHTDPWEFDPEFFGISPREATSMDPQQRLIMEVAWEAADDAGVAGRLAGEAVGVYVGAFNVDFSVSTMAAAALPHIDMNTSTAASFTMLSNRLAYALNLVGPALTIDTACSSSLVAFHLACQGIANGDCEMALAGGVNLMLQPETFVSMCKGGFLAADGRSKPFSAHADGYGRGEGAGMVVLRRLEDAVRDGDRIYAVVEATGSNQDGHTTAITVPNGDSQEALARLVCARSGLAPHQVTYIEAHGTGTPVGDPIELGALGRVYGRADGRTRPLSVGSLKATLGHTEAASGIAGVIKGALAIYHRTLPPQGWFDDPNPEIPFDELRLSIQVEPEALDASIDRMAVAVNGFGYGGTNAHVILAAPEARPAPPTPAAPTTRRTAGVFPISARSEAATRALAGAYADLLEAGAAPGELIEAAWNRRAHQRHRAAVTFSDPADLSERLRQVCSGGAPVGSVVDNSAGLVFVFSGMGTQWWAMGRDLLTAGGVFAAEAARIDEAFQDIADWSIVAELSRPENESRITSTAIAQPTTFLLQVALTRELAQFGITPSALVGHSMGEVPAAYLAGALSLHDALLVTYHRARLQATTAGTGGMLAVGLPYSELEPLLGADMRIDVAAINGPSAVTVAGVVSELQALAQILTERGVFNRLLRVEVPYHSHRMDPILAELRSELGVLAPQQPTVPLYSTVTAAAVTSGLDAEYWCANVRRPVRFADTVKALMAAGHRTFLEVGPHPALSANIRELLLKTHEPGAAIPTLRRNEPDAESIRQAIADLYTAGALDATDLCRTVTPHVELPRYPWQRQRLRDELPEFTQMKFGTEDSFSMLGDPDLDHPAAWELHVSGQVLPWLTDHVVNGVCLLPGMAYVDAALSAAAARSGLKSAIVEDIRFAAPLFFDPADGAILRTELDEASRRFTIRSRAATGRTWTTHATGRLVDGKCSPTKHHVPDAADMTAIDPGDLYAAMAGNGMTYGPSFRRVTSLRANLTQAVGTVDARPDEGTRHLAHPGVIDAALHTISPLIEQSVGRTLGTIVPIGVDVVRVFGPFPDCVEVITTVHPNDPLRADIAILDSQRMACAQLSGVRFGSITPGQGPIDRLDPLFYEEVWELCDELDIATLPSPEHTATLVLALGDEPSPRARHLAEALSHATLYHCADAADVDAELMHLLGVASGHFPQIHVCVVAGRATDDSSALWLLKQIAITTERFVRENKGEQPEELEARGDEGFYASLVTEQAFSHPNDVSAPDVSHAGLAGARRSLIAEQSRLRWRLIDVGPDTELTELLPEVSVPGAFTQDKTDEIILRNGSRWAVVVTQTLSQRVESMAQQHPLTDPDANFAVDLPKSRILSELGWRSCARPAPGAGEVELRMQVVGLNYKDAIKVVGLLGKRELEGTHFGTDLGMEGVGVITRVGPGVAGFEIGDVVTTAARGMLIRYQIADAALCIKLPESAATRFRPEFCTSMTAFITAEYALLELARLKAGETVLIHGAAGGVGQAAIQIAKLCGATVIGTASTNERRSFALGSGADYMIDSRSLNFVDDVRELAGGRGVDVIISSAPGEILRHNFEAVVEFGRIVEVGKADIYGNSTLDMGVLDKNLGYFQIDMDRFMKWDPQACLKREADIYEKFASGIYLPLPVEVFDAADIGRACEEVFRSSRTSRVALRLADNTPPVKPGWHDVVTDPDASYLITGGHGGFGLATGRWLVRRGARHLVLASRSGATTELARRQIARWRNTGITVAEELVDMTDARAVAALVDRCSSGSRPLRGIFHAAGAIADQRIADMSLADLKRVYDVKVNGGRALWSAVQAAGITLDQFVFYSSAGAMLGLLGQFGYAAANFAVQALTDSIAQQGRPAMCIGWGHMSGTGGGMATDENLARHMIACGVDPIEMDDGPLYLEEALRLGVRRASIISINWSQLDTVFGHFRQLLRTSTVISTAAESNSAQDRLRANLIALDEDERGAVLGYMLAEQLATVMGVSTDSIDIDVPVMELGLNSLMAVEFSARTGEAIGVSLNTLMLGPSYNLRKAGAALAETIVAGAGK
ncbi:type I polyketide synthase [Mycobacterium sp. TY814]|uniref:type I polyketide synthase n=1 Tax=unclassified Mycobacterium TaxID=2642494 RepID=UPI0027411C6E|nr:type I polyketide synthase [Mycobacterium sp. TY814]MDP7722115.1 type I polyketide synthase [Mycobacterium sp. TY814]